jgi:type I restriction enzyme, S subunit
MNAERLLAHYEQIADAPDAIARLRRFILDLAARGKLVPQDPNDEPASELLKRIAREELDQAGLPRQWRRAKIGWILDFQYGKGLKANERLDEGPVPVFGSNGIVGFTNEPLSVRPSIIIGRKGSAGALNLCDGPSWTTDVAYFLEPPSFLDLRFLLNALAALDLDKLGKGVKPGLSRSEAYEQIIALPPFAEQHRIVAKVDELMGLCDRLEAARGSREAARDRLAAASLARLNAPNPETFQADARFALDRLPALTTRSDQIKAFRQTILNLAVRGKLVPQDAKDEPANELLKRIEKEIPASKAGNSKVDDPAPYDAPQGWVWTYLGRLVARSDAGWSPKTLDCQRSGDEWGVLKVSAVSWDKFRASENKQVLPGTEPRFQAEVKQGDFLISRANTAELIARAVLVDGPAFKLMMSDKIVRLHLTADCNHRFVWIVNNYADFAREHYVRHASGVSPSMKNVSRDVILNLPLPLPPLAE